MEWKQKCCVLCCAKHQAIVYKLLIEYVTFSDIGVVEVFIPLWVQTSWAFWWMSGALELESEI